MTDAFGPLPVAEVAERRMELGMQVVECLGVEGTLLVVSGFGGPGHA